MSSLTVVLLFVVTVQTATLFDQSAQHLCRQRVDLRSQPADLAIFAIAWAGDVSAVLLITIRTYRLIFGPKRSPTRLPSDRWNEVAR